VWYGFAYPLELLLAEVVRHQRLHPLDNARLRHVQPRIRPVDNRKHAQGGVAADLLEKPVLVIAPRKIIRR
jgi:hypothetical protein